MISRLVRSLTLVPRFLYAAQEKKNTIVVPRRYQIPFNQFNHLESQIQISPNCKTLAVLIKENLQLFTDFHITRLFKHIGYYDLVIDDHFHTVIAPIAVEWVKTFNREQAPTIGSILLAITARNIPTPELQQLVVKKLDEQNIYRYLDLRETVSLFLSLSKHSRFLNSSLLNKLQNVIYQQKADYSHHPELLEAIRQGLDAVQANSKGEKPLQINAAYKQIS